MDRMSMLPDDLIFKILSFVPSKVAVTTSLISKRWCSLWKHVPSLVYVDPSIDSEYWRASRFIDKFLLLRDDYASLGSMHLYVSQYCSPTDIETWVGIAVSRGVRDLMFYQFSGIWYQPIRLPRSMYTCETLVTLSLLHASIVDVPLNICFRSLKSLCLIFVDFPSDETVHRLLSGCLVLEDLKVVRGNSDNVKTFKIMVPSLQRLTVSDVFRYGHAFGYVIKAPSLKSLAITSPFGSFYSLVKMPYLVKANIMLKHGDSKNLLGCVTSAKHLSLCVNQDFYPIGDFNEPVSLNVCTCSLVWYRLILRRAPKLRFLTFLGQVNSLPTHYLVQTQWERPSSVPECLISSLETVEWMDYKGTEAENEEVLYLVNNSGGRLKTVAVTPTGGKRHMILVEPSRRSCK